MNASTSTDIADNTMFAMKTTLRAWSYAWIAAARWAGESEGMDSVEWRMRSMTW
jgi:hypothetical protein